MGLSRPLEAAPSAPVPLYCIPHAGAGASFFKGWQDAAGPALTIVPVQLPGREELIDQDPYADWREAVCGLEAEVFAAGSTPMRLALFGHSFGAVLAYELARLLSARCRVEVVRLFVSGSPGPRAGRARRASGLSDAEFLNRVQEFAGYRHPAFDIPEVVELILPVLRADVLMHERYRPLRDDVPDVPITCLRGTDDDLVPARDAAGWTEATSGECDLVELPGGHMYLVDHAAELLTIITARLRG
jgi:surfactin synthase thioesterase subunit